ECSRVRWSAAFGVGVIEVAEHVATTGSNRGWPPSNMHRPARTMGGLFAGVPSGDTLRPAGECYRPIPTAIEVTVAVQTDVHEIGGHVVWHRPLFRGLSDDQRYIVLAQQRKTLIEEACMANFYRV